MKIQLTNSNELKAIWAIKNRCVDCLRSQNIITWDEQYPSFSVFETDQRKGNLYSIFEKNNIIGCIAVNKEMAAEYCEVNWSDVNFLVIRRLMIDPDHQGKGYAKQAIYQIEKLLADRGVTSLRLAVYEINKSANVLYQKSGYNLKGKVMLKNGMSFMYEKNIAK